MSQNVETITIKKATIDDAVAMDTMNRKCLPENYPLLEWKTILTFMPSISYVAMVNNDYVGYCLGIIEQGTFSKLSDRTGIIASIAVLPNHRGKKIGEKILEKSLEAMKELNLSHVTLHVRISNVVAQKLYYNMGFRKHKRIPAYYVNGEDAYLMRKELTE